MTVIRWGIIGPGAIAHNFADGLAESASGRLVALAGRDDARRDAFADRYAIDRALRFADAAALAASDAVDAVYIATPHPAHAALSVMALRAGKAVLCEKPAGLNAAEVIAVTEVAAQTGRFFAEGFMYRCHPQIARVLEVIGAREIGQIVHIQSRFGFQAGFDAASRLYAKDLGGGGILDVGGYPVSLVRLIAGAAQGLPFAEPLTFRATGVLAETGVDAVAQAMMTFAGGLTAEIACAVARQMDNRAIIEGTKGRIVIDDPWVPGRNKGPSDATIHITVGGKTRTDTLHHPEMLFAFEAEAASRAIAARQQEMPHPGSSWADSIGTAHLQDRWRAEIGYVTFAEDPATNRRLNGLLPTGLPQVPRLRLAGLDRDVSQLIIGCDNRNTVAEGALVWDTWIEAGGNAFDSGFVYGGGLHEKVLGDWIAARGVADDVVVIGKGAHSPYCTPRAIEAQLDISLDRLRLTSVPIYIMHRDNPDVPVGEFVDALNRLKAKGRIGIFGGSNWSVARFAEANDYAQRNGLEPMRLLNNNLSLAVMEKPVWPGCVTSNTPETLDFLRRTGTFHLSWSAQARGYFLPEDLRNRLPADTAPETCFGSPANAERRRRAETLAAQRSTTAHAVAAAWVLAQSFPSLALIGPRSPGEIVSSLPALSVRLAGAERGWLNLERDSR
jgi:predicted dehydrogenase/aryl-alcohol dehydrogenase-like predicted oxidoreductase